MKNVDVDEPTSFLDLYTWDALNANANRTMTLSINVEKCSNHEFLLLQLKNYQFEKNLTRKL